MKFCLACLGKCSQSENFFSLCYVCRLGFRQTFRRTLRGLSVTDYQKHILCRYLEKQIHNRNAIHLLAFSLFLYKTITWSQALPSAFREVPEKSGNTWNMVTSSSKVNGIPVNSARNHFSQIDFFGYQRICF